LNNGEIKSLFSSTLMFWTGHQRDSSSVLAEQKANTAAKIESLLRMRGHAFELQRLASNGTFDVRKFGRVLHESWTLKRSLSSKITNKQIDEWYQRAIDAGAEGGKLCGAGGGGFLLFICRPERQEAVRRALDGLTLVPVAHEVHGSQVCSPFVQ
jgi:D-glycero-alpha-D-manno-heptose-7-phosphate kinase